MLPSRVLALALLSPGLCLGQAARGQSGESFPVLVPPLGQPGGAVPGPGAPPVTRLCFLPGPLPKPSLQALPSALVPLERPVTIRCSGPPGVDLYRLEKLQSGSYEDRDVLFIPAMKTNHAGRYRCSYQNGSRWSPPSDNLELVATGNGLGVRVWPPRSPRAMRPHFCVWRD